MNRTTVAIGLFIIAVAGLLAGRFGLPYIVERQVSSALDEHIAGLPDATGAGYTGLSLDYWNDQLRVEELRLPLDLPRLGGAPYPALVTVRDVFVDGYDWPRLEAALTTGQAAAASPATPMIRQVSWSGVALQGQASADPLGTADAGQLDGLRDLTIDTQDGAVTAVAFDALTLGAMIVTPSAGYLGANDTTTVRAELPLAVVTGWRHDGADSIALTGLKLTVVAQDGTDGGAGGGSAEVTLGSYTLLGWQKGEIVTVESSSLKDMSVVVNMPAPTDQAASPEIADMLKGPVSISLDSHEMSDGRYDPQALDLRHAFAEWHAFIEGMETRQPGGAFEADFVARHAESILVLLERARDLDLGTRRATMTGLKMSFGAASSMEMDRLEVRDAVGLKGGAFEIRGYRQSSLGDVQMSADRYHGQGGDYSALPAWARQVFGQPLTADSLAKARAWAESRTIAEILPVVDFGTLDMEGMTVSRPGAKPVNIDLITIDRMRFGAGGQVEIGFRVDGMTARLNGDEAAPPQAAMFLQMLKANGVEDLRMGTAIGLKAGLADNSGSLTVGMSGKELAEVRAELDLSGVDFERLRRTPAEQRNMVALASSLAQARITLMDQGVRLLLLQSQAAQRPGATAEMIGAQFGAMAEQTGASMGTDASRAIGQQLAAFVTSGGTLTITTGLPQPIPIMQLMGLQRQPPAQIIDRLGITATHTGP